MSRERRAESECDLKKQSQFLKGQNDVKSIVAMVYGDFDGPGRRENKAGQSQFSGHWRETRSTKCLPELPFSVCHSEAKPKKSASEMEILHFAALRSE
jgi:hypothetical protein